MQLSAKIKVAGVSYLNTKPMLYGIDHSPVKHEIDLMVDYPARLVKHLQDGTADMALLPVAAIPLVPGARIVSDYGIGAFGEVASVCIFSHVPMEEITTVYLDYQSRTSVRLAQLLLENHWKQPVTYQSAPENYIEYIHGHTAGVIIGDRALKQRSNFPYIYDLSSAWKDFSGLPFIFAAWVASRDLPQDFLDRFNEATAYGLKHLDEVVEQNPFPWYDLHHYYTDNIMYRLTDEMKEGMKRFLAMIKS